MLLIISPAKTQDFNVRNYPHCTVPVLLKQSRLLIDLLRQLSAAELGRLMKISPKLSELNRQRYEDFHPPFELSNARQALLAFRGDVYSGIDADHYGDEDFSFAQQHLRILSGLYGVLKPLDLIQPYRLEMGTRLANSRGKDLYDFWGTIITDELNEDLQDEAEPVLVNLASQEYFKAIKPRTLQARLLTISFKENKNNRYQVIGIHAKRARGLMTDFVIRNRITALDDLQSFTQNGYQFRSSLSSETEWVFCRD
ncbi:MAG: peroxide stress protein YaaA [Proteobacteria bacterium]|nr:peroxide stress protein YaaA [Pseudomonadota bacterium]